MKHIAIEDSDDPGNEKSHRDNGPSGLPVVCAPKQVVCGDDAPVPPEDGVSVPSKISPDAVSASAKFAARQAKAKLSIKAQDAENDAARYAAKTGGLPWVHGGREFCSELRRQARLPASRPRNAIAAQEYRARQRVLKREIAIAAATMMADLEMPDAELSATELEAEVSALDSWLALKGPRQRQISPFRESLIASRTLLLVMRAERGAGFDIGPTEFAARLSAKGLPFNRYRAHTRLKLLASLEAPTGPWCAKGQG